MKYRVVFLLCLTSILNMSAQTVRKFTLSNSSDGESTLACYLPQNPTGRAVVDCPGGGYSHLSMVNEGSDWVSYFNEKGIAYFVLKYRMPNGDRQIPLSDAYNAIKTVRDSADAWHINPYDVGIMGFSAGGHLASTVSTHAPWECRPNFSILFYPVISMDERVTHKGSCVGFLGEGRHDKELVKQFSNDRQVRCHTTPPAIILLANDDRAVPPVTNGVAYYSAMRNQGNECSMYIYPTGGHGFGFRSNFKYHDQMLNDLSTWLEHLKMPAKDAIRVACVGNSITEGYGIAMSSQLGYPAQLQKLMGDQYQVRNFGVSAHTMLNKGDMPYMNRPEWEYAKAFNPQVVIVKLGTNDSKPWNWQHGKEFGKDLQQMIDELKALPAKPTIYLATPLKIFDNPYQINDTIVTNEIIPIINKVAKKNKLSIIDLHEKILNKEMFKSDGVHPNEKGTAEMAKIIADVIKQ